jgi:hypothetical protein
MHDDWHMERVVAAIRSAAQAPGEPEVADALAAAVAKQQARERVAARKRKREETEAAHRQEEEAVISGLRVELRALCATDPAMTLLMAVEYSTSNPARRLSLYRRCCAEDQSICGMGQDDARSSKIAPSVAKDLALLERRARAEGFRVEEEGMKP